MHRCVLAAVWVGAALALSAGAGLCREMVVDQKSPQADDGNPGTEELPLKTIQPAVDAANPGDTIWVKAGTYDQPINITRSGTINAPIVLSAWQDDRVRIGSDPKDLPPADQWRPLPDSRSWQVQLPEGTPDNLIVIIDDKPQFATDTKIDGWLVRPRAGIERTGAIRGSQARVDSEQSRTR